MTNMFNSISVHSSFLKSSLIFLICEGFFILFYFFFQEKLTLAIYFGTFYFLCHYCVYIVIIFQIRVKPLLFYISKHCFLASFLGFKHQNITYSILVRRDVNEHVIFLQ